MADGSGVWIMRIQRQQSALDNCLEKGYWTRAEFHARQVASLLTELRKALAEEASLNG